jgi:hypothetical protein
MYTVYTITPEDLSPFVTGVQEAIVPGFIVGFAEVNNTILTDIYRGAIGVGLLRINQTLVVIIPTEVT